MMHKPCSARPHLGGLLFLGLLGWAGCGGAPIDAPPDSGVTDGPASLDLLAPADLAPRPSAIQHVVLIVQENHTFDTYFGRYCTAPAGSDPTCTAGPSCCERAPATEPSGSAPVTLDDALNAGRDPDHTMDCEAAEMNGGRMDRYVTGTACSDARNFAIAPSALVQPYHDLATRFALADRYFQPLVGQSSANDMYFAVGRFVFKDNDLIPAASGHGCWYPTSSTTSYKGEKTIADLLIGAGRSFAVYAEGYQAMKDALLCPFARPADCTFPAPLITPNSCVYDPSDYPFQYYAQFADNDLYIKDFSRLTQDVQAGTLPTFAFVKGTSYHTEHPNFGNRVSTGAAFVKGVVDAILGSAYAADTLVLITWDEGGGFYDHVAPPAASPVDGKPYGTRVPLLAVGRFARKGQVSHVPMEHSSILRFLEYNFLGQQVGQLGARDAVVSNLGSLLDPAETGLVIPER